MKAVIEKILRENINGIDVKSTALIDDGYIKSLGVIQLVAAFDEEFDIEIQFTSITKENFNSVEAMEKMVKSYLPK